MSIYWCRLKKKLTTLSKNLVPAGKVQIVTRLSCWTRRANMSSLFQTSSIFLWSTFKIRWTLTSPPPRPGRTLWLWLLKHRLTSQLSWPLKRIFAPVVSTMLPTFFPFSPRIRLPWARNSGISSMGKVKSSPSRSPRLTPTGCTWRATLQSKVSG